MGEWQPMETAPKTDETYVLLMNGEGYVAVGYYSMAGWTLTADGFLARDENGNFIKMDPPPCGWLSIPAAGHADIPAGRAALQQEGERHG